MVSEESSEFCGNFEHSLDPKGRVSFPSQFRSVLQLADDDYIVLTNFICDGARCLEGFTPKSWRELQAKLSERSRFSPQVKTLENYYISRAVKCSLDGSGRILIPSHLREYAGLKKDVVFTSALRGFRIWDMRVWEMIFQDAESALLENPALFEDIDI